jgi:hypothetical protein
MTITANYQLKSNILLFPPTVLDNAVSIWYKVLIWYIYSYIVTDLINALPGNRSVKKVQHATIEEAVFSVDPTDAPIDWLDSDHVMCLLYVHSAAI